jgi:hypothetical protein
MRTARKASPKPGLANGGADLSREIPTEMVHGSHQGEFRTRSAMGTIGQKIYAYALGSRSDAVSERSLQAAEVVGPSSEEGQGRQG